MTITVELVAKSVGTPLGCPALSTLRLYYPRAFIHEQFLTHRALSKNSESSRAKPISKVVEQVRKDPALPVFWGANGVGMNDHGEMSPEAQAYHKREWLRARDEAVATVGRMIKYRGGVPHKQITNRLLGPWQHIAVTVSATDWDNFLALRCEDGQPEIKELANKIGECLAAAKPRKIDPGEWHLPFIQEFELGAVLLAVDPAVRAAGLDVLKKISAARCARVSYRGHDGRPTTEEQDLQTYEKLVSSGHMHASPMEHQGTPDTLELLTVDGKLVKKYGAPRMHGNFTGWVQHRKTLPGNTVTRYTWKKGD